MINFLDENMNLIPHSDSRYKRDAMLSLQQPQRQPMRRRESTGRVEKRLLRSEERRKVHHVPKDHASHRVQR